MALLLLLPGCLFLMEQPSPCPETCPGHFVCDDALGCMTTCAYGGDDCEEGYFCTHEDKQSGECRVICQDGDCPGNFACWGDDDCYESCSEDDECAQGYQCCGPEDNCRDSQWNTCVRD